MPPMLRRTLATPLLHLAAVAFIVACGSSARPTAAADEGWVSLFDGKTLDGWRASDQPGTFRVENGTIVVNGPRSHLFYMGPVNNHDFRNFEWKADVMTFPKANSGMYFHTEFQETGWPQKGYEVQVNNSHSDPIRTGSLYGIVNVTAQHARDNEWFTQHIIVQGKRIVVKVNGETLVDYTEPANVERTPDTAGRKLSSGTFALQGHDPESKVLYRNIMVKVLPD
jgi:3-keto-disaccharide hydrolase